MKKITHILAIIVMCFTCLATAVACSCSGPKVESLSVKSGLKTTYLKGDEVSFDDLKVKVVYDDGTEETVGKDQLTISDFTTEAVGTYDVKISYKEKEITVKIKVTANKDEVYDILAVENNKNFVQYGNALNPSQSADAESIFKDTSASVENAYKVGYDNPFVYNMNLTALDEDGNYVEGLETTKTVTRVFVKDTLGGQYTEVTGADIDTYVTIDDEESSYQFKAAANGKFFKLAIRPYYLKEEQLLTVENFTKEIEFQVVEGYNVTDAKELGILYNVNENGNYDYENMKDSVNLYNAWTEFLTANGIARKDNVKAIILHNDINITGADIPSVYLATPADLATPTYSNENAEPTNDYAVYTDASGNRKVLENNFDAAICSNSNIYCHKVNENSTFTIYGNFFTLNAKLPTVDTDILRNWGSTTSLFRFVSTYSEKEYEATTLANNAAAVAASQNTKVNIYNLNTSGNAARTDSTNLDNNRDSAQMGGLIFFKGPAVTVNVYNSIVKAYLINFYLEERLANINVYNTKSYDAYQSIVYGYDGGTMYIDNSNFERAGGPVILLASDDNDPSQMITTNIVVSENSKLESLVTGLEPWFSIYGKSELATQLKANAGVFEGMFSSTFIHSGEDADIELQLVNAVLVSISNDDDTSDTNTTHAMLKFTIGETVVADTTGMNGTIESGSNKEFINSKTNVGGIVFESTNGGLVTSETNQNNATTESNFMNYFDVQEYMQYGEEYAAGMAMQRWSTAVGASSANDYVGIYTYGMAMVTGYYPATTPAA